MNCTGVDCWTLRGGSCDAWDGVPDCCLTVLELTRNVNIYTNVVYAVFGILLPFILWVLQEPIDASVVEYTYSTFAVMFASTFYHLCSGVFNPCYKHCYIDFESAAIADFVSALFLVHFTTCVRWNQNSSLNTAVMLVTMVMLTIWLRGWAYGDLSVAVSVGVVNLFSRWIADQLHFRPEPWGFGLACIAAGCLIVAVLCEFTEVLDQPYGVTHPIWHCLTATGSFLFALSLEAGNGKSGYTKLNKSDF
jgi:hypothetical protein